MGAPWATRPLQRFALWGILPPLLLLISPAIRGYYDLRPMAERLATLEAQSRPLAYVGEYHDQFRFLGRLVTDMTTLDDDRAVTEWAARHPRGHIIEKRREPTPRQVEIAGYHQPYRGRIYLIVPADRWPAFIAAGDD
ncbi:hypothetical protein BOX17_04595 [Halomonas aestuarii]|uniref:Uncharacterized protein n=1 Tax=Halomonas aestuarii TaxID=1897729 RepID=A0A1J0VE34_9GAMM|nr:hypothetical protein [Halomonas aestuarii]APE30292.1 hypothetical protein BOX17_04595 [Halomonas aestuarii]